MIDNSLTSVCQSLAAVRRCAAHELFRCTITSFSADNMKLSKSIRDLQLPSAHSFHRRSGPARGMALVVLSLHCFLQVLPRPFTHQIACSQSLSSASAPSAGPHQSRHKLPLSLGPAGTFPDTPIQITFCIHPVEPTHRRAWLSSAMCIVRALMSVNLC